MLFLKKNIFLNFRFVFLIGFVLVSISAFVSGAMAWNPTLAHDTSADCANEGGHCLTTPPQANCPNTITEDQPGMCDRIGGAESACCRLKATATGPGTDDYCVNTLLGECKTGPSSCIAPITELGSCTTLASVARKCCSKAVATPTCGPSPLPACCAGTTPPAPCPGTPLPGASASIAFTNPIGGANNSTVEGVVGSISVVLQGIIVVLALVFIVIGAVIYVTSAGNDERMKTAKGAITAAMIGLALAIAAPSFLKQIASVLGWNTTVPSLTGAKTLTALALSVLQFLLSIIGILGIIMLVIGGLAYLTSAGDEERAGTGKKIITYAIIGIAVALASLIIVTQVAKLFV